jgi:uncharacterized membrane protein YhaH (DUF805 family)
MNKEKNIYNFKAPKSSNEEVNFFNIKGRINTKAFFVRLLLVVGIYFLLKVLFNFGFHKNFGVRFENFYETIYLFILPIIFTLFVLIQGAKRMHDINKSGWTFLIPFYNLYLVFLPGTKGNNDYGIDYNITKDVTYFDELDDSQTKSNNSQIIKNQNDKYFSFVIFFAFILLIVISAWYSSNNNNNSLPTNTTADSSTVDSTTIVEDSAAPAKIKVDSGTTIKPNSKTKSNNNIKTYTSEELDNILKLLEGSNNKLVWEGEDKNGFISQFKKINDKEWTETYAEKDNIRNYTEIYNTEDSFTLKDNNRIGVYIYISGGTCYYKDDNTDWVLIYNGRWL